MKDAKVIVRAAPKKHHIRENMAIVRATLQVCQLPAGRVLLLAMDMYYKLLGRCLPAGFDGNANKRAKTLWLATQAYSLKKLVSKVRLGPHLCVCEPCTCSKCEARLVCTFSLSPACSFHLFLFAFVCNAALS